MKKRLVKGAYLTDIHFGKKANSELHNDDCLRFIDWFCVQAQEKGCDYIAFLGDWNENRSALNIATLNASYRGAKKLNALGLPVFFCVGNHDLYHRHTREVYSVVPFNEFTNFTVIAEPLVIDHIGDGALFSPYMFHDEYPGLTQYLKLPYWAGHFEFQGFVVTGYTIKMHTGPDPSMFKGPKHIISGHFHKRQTQDNITYMGNVFPMDFGDAGDYERGMMVYDHIAQTMEFTNWKDCPVYIKTKLTHIIEDSSIILPQSRVRCIIDEPGISFEEVTMLRASMIEKYDLREFIMEETGDMNDALTKTTTDAEVQSPEFDSESGKIITGGIDEVVVEMLKDIKSDSIDNDLLIEQYRKIQI